VIQSALYFALGLLCAGLVMMVAAPFVWRRAVVLTRRRIEASVPLSVDEILSHKDRMRAEHAMAQRRLEMSVQELRHKVATQLADIGNKGAQMRALTADKEDREAKFKAMEEKLAARTREAVQAQADVERVSDDLRQAEEAIEERGNLLDEMGRQVEAISLTVSNREVDLAARGGDIDRLNSELSAMREQRRELERELRDAKSEARTANDALESEARRSADLLKKNEALIARLSQQEELVERRERELERMRAKAKEVRSSAAADLPQRAKAEPEAETVSEPAVDIQSERIKIAELMSPLVGELPDGDIGKAAKKLSREIKRDREKMAKMEKTIEALQSQVEARGAGRKTGESDTAALRDQISEIAAEMINITALLEGPESPIPEILGKQGAGSNGSGRRSLADRVKALQKAADKQAGKAADS
jgi:chromosome segregation ATPase